MTHSIHKEGDVEIYPRVIFCETRHKAKAHVISGPLIHCAFSLTTRKIQTAA